jgi:ankyrin repeat protein
MLAGISRYMTQSLHRSLARRAGYLPTKLRLIVGANPNDGDNSGFTPVHKAAILGNAPAMRALLETRGVSVNIVTDKGKTPLQLACSDDFPSLATPKSRAKVMDMLLQAGAWPNTDYDESNIQGSALYLAAKNNNDDQVCSLLEAGAKVDRSKLPDSEKPLIKLLLKLHLDRKDPAGKTDGVDLFHDRYPEGNEIELKKCRENFLRNKQSDSSRQNDAFNDLGSSKRKRRPGF